MPFSLRFIALISLFLLAAAKLHAQQGPPPEVGFFRLVNLVAPGEGRTDFSLDGRSIYKKGYKLGQKTGGMGRKAGTYELTVSKTGCTAGERKLKVDPGTTQTFVAYALPVRDDVGEIIEWKIEIARLKQDTPDEGYSVTIVSFCEEKALKVGISTDAGKKNLHQVPQKIAKRIPLRGGASGISVTVGDEVVGGFSPDDPGNYVVLIYDTEGKKKQAVTFYDPKFLVAG